MSEIDTDALDEAVRRFPTLISSYRKSGCVELLSFPPGTIEAIQREYRLVLDDRCKVPLA